MNPTLAPAHCPGVVSRMRHREEETKENTQQSRGVEETEIGVWENPSGLCLWGRDSKRKDYTERMLQKLKKEPLKSLAKFRSLHMSEKATWGHGNNLPKAVG